MEKGQTNLHFLYQPFKENSVWIFISRHTITLSCFYTVVCVCVSVCVIHRVPQFQNKPQMFPLWCGQEEGATSCWLGGSRRRLVGQEPLPLMSTLRHKHTHTHKSKINCLASNDRQFSPYKEVSPHSVGAKSPLWYVNRSRLTSCDAAAVSKRAVEIEKTWRHTDLLQHSNRSDSILIFIIAQVLLCKQWLTLHYCLPYGSDINSAILEVIVKMHYVLNDSL